MKKVAAVLIILLIPAVLFGLSYSSSKFGYSVDMPSGWKDADTENPEQVVFVSEAEDAAFGVIAFKVTGPSVTAQVVMDQLVSRLRGRGKPQETTFVGLSAVRGNVTFTASGMKIRADIIVVRTPAVCLAFMAYCPADSFNAKKSEFGRIFGSVKLDAKSTQDPQVTEARETDGKRSDPKITEDTETEIGKKDPVKTVLPDGPTYTLQVTWGSATHDFSFLTADLKAALQEMNALMKELEKKMEGFQGETDPQGAFWTYVFQYTFSKNYGRLTNFVAYFKEQAVKNGWSAFDLATAVCMCIQNITYAMPQDLSKEKGSVAKELGLFTPPEVGQWKAGDCDSKSLMVLIILRNLGYDGCLFVSTEYGHAMLGLSVNATGSYLMVANKRYYFVEITSPGWSIGTLPQVEDKSKWQAIAIN